MFNYCFIVITLVVWLQSACANEHSNEHSNEGFCLRKEDCENDLHLFATNELNGMKYLLYDVSREQSMSKRRRMYIEAARTVQQLGSNWTLVLPPWGTYTPRWQEHNESINKIRWSEFFKIEILQELIAVIEFDEFIEHVANELDIVLVFNRFNEIDEQVESKKYELYEENCKHIQFYEKDHHIFGFFFGYKDYLKAKRLICASVNRDSGIVKNLLENDLKHLHTIYIQNLDLTYDEDAKDHTYWLFRRSMQLSDSVINRANKFRRKYFDSDDEKDKTFISSDWQLQKLNRQKQSDEPIGGHYLAIHWIAINDQQVDDTIVNHDSLSESNETQSDELEIKHIANQILIGLKSVNLTWTFVATNAQDTQWNALNNAFKELIATESRSPDKYKLFRYKNKSNKLSPVEHELIEQWICSHARLFIGTSNSMYTQQVEEQREILAFQSSTTFNFLCTNQSMLCPVIRPSRIKY